MQDFEVKTGGAWAYKRGGPLKREAVLVQSDLNFCDYLYNIIL